METNSVSPENFYSIMNYLIEDFQKMPEEEKLENLYNLMVEHFKKGNSYYEVKQLKELEIKLLNAKVDTNDKIMLLINEKLGAPLGEEVFSEDRHRTQEDKQPNILQILPKDMLKEIMSYLIKEFPNIALISKEFNHLVQEPLFQAILLERYAKRLNIDQIAELCKTCGASVKKLELTRYWNKATSEQLQSVIDLCPNLQELDLEGCAINDEGMKSIGKLHALNSLNLSFCNKFTNIGLQSLIKLDKLEFLNLNNCNMISDLELEVIGKLHQLKHLNLMNCDLIKDKGLEFLEKLDKLQTLLFSNSTKITDKGLISIGKMINLQRLILSYCLKITDVGLKSIEFLEELKVLDLTNSKKISDSGLTSIVKLKNLEELSLRYCRNVSNNAIPLFHQMPHLQILDVYDTGLTYDQLKSINIKTVIPEVT